MRTFAEKRPPVPVGAVSLLRLPPYSMASAAFIVAAIVVALIRAIVPFPHGWWLVAYLLLVGALAQVLLGSGTATSAGGRRLDARFWLWNAGTVAVAVGDPLGAPAAVLAGSVALLAALALFASDAARRAAYLLLIIFMAGSVLVGCFLGRAFPWQ